MKAKHSRYGRYKTSKLPWLGEIPEHWNLRRLKSIADVTPSNVDKHVVTGERAVRLCNYVDVYKHDKITDDIEFMAGTASPEELARFGLRAGDVIITKDSESWEDIAVSAFVPKKPEDVVCGYHLALIRANEELLDGRYLFRAFSARGINDQFRIAANGITRFALGQDAIGTALFPVPPLPEQRAIAVFLDRETARIDTLIAKKERLLELLEEKRTALITRAVTKGLDPAVPLKESGVEWLGEVPTHWAIAPLYSKYDVALGKMLDEKRITGAHLAPYIRNVNVQWDRLAIDELPTMDFEPAERAKFRLSVGDLLVCEGGEVGRTAVWRGELAECYYQKAVHRLRAHHPEQSPRFLFYLMHAAAKLGVFVAGANPNTINHLTAEMLGHHRFPFPLPEEQRRIAEFLDAETERLDALTAKVRHAIALLREYRTALISAAVTGQIDVSAPRRRENP